MGNEQFFPPNTKLTRIDKKDDADDVLIVVGGGDELIVTSAVEYGGARTININIAREDYEAELPEGYTPQEQERSNSSLTPEQIFAKAARDNPVEPRPNQRRGRKRSDAPAETREGGE